MSDIANLRDLSNDMLRRIRELNKLKDKSTKKAKTLKDEITVLQAKRKELLHKVMEES